VAKMRYAELKQAYDRLVQENSYLRQEMKEEPFRNMGLLDNFVGGGMPVPFLRELLQSGTNDLLSLFRIEEHELGDHAITPVAHAIDPRGHWQYKSIDHSGQGARESDFYELKGAYLRHQTVPTVMGPPRGVAYVEHTPKRTGGRDSPR